ncbi:MAG TPA: ABC transporter permease subunit [Casimicrobiaceae bacterium]|nr:ABC transporter permease subunit [Casimicrobiaceae bacterium]
MSSAGDGAVAQPGTAEEFKSDEQSAIGPAQSQKTPSATEASEGEQRAATVHRARAGHASRIGTIFRRELASYFATPVAYVFIVIFLVLAGVFTFYLGHFYERGQADLIPFFSFHPWLYLFLVPAISMRMWSEERKSGTIEMLLTLPVTMWQAVVGKFLAAWAFIGLALLLTFPIWITVNYLGSPDNGVIVASYLGSFLMAGAFLAIGSCLSACTRSQVVAFILTAVVCFVFLLAGFPLVLGFFSAWAPQGVIDAISGLSFLAHFNSIARGVVDLRDIVYFVLTIAFWLYASAVVIDLRKAD